MDCSNAKRIRSVNYSFEETELLVTLVEKWKNVLECKATDMVSLNEKEKTWNLLAEQFNSMKGANRSGKMLKNKWESIKKATKVEYSKIKNSTKATGGGPSNSFNLKGIGERVLAIVGVGITGTSNSFDCDIQKLEVIHTDDLSGTTDKPIEVPIEDTMNNKPEMNLQEKWSTWSPAVLEQPVTPALVLEPIDEPSLVTNNGDETKTPKVSHKRRLSKKNMEQNVYETLAQKKIKLVELQIQNLEKENQLKQEKFDFELKQLKEKHDLEAKQSEEKHEIEMNILKKKLQQYN